MKLHYEKPLIEIEEFELITVIATGCGTVVDLGPGDSCDSYPEDLGQATTFSLAPSEQNFYEGSCSCYLSGGGSTVFTS